MSNADWRSYGEPELPRVLAAALDSFAETGYHGTSIRVLAKRSGLSVPGLYHYYASKQTILVDLMTAVMEEVLARSQAALAEADSAPRARFDALVESLLRFHMFRRVQAFVASSEIRSLEPKNRARYVRMRDEQQRLLDEVIVEGVAAGVFTTAYPYDAGRAIATMCVGVASWFRDDGPLEPDEVVERYLELAHGLVGTTGRPA